MSVDGSPGISKPALDAIQRNVAKAKYLNKELYCGLIVDDMSIKKLVEWNGKKLVGYVDFGTQLNSDSLPEAKYAMVIMAVCFNMYWKIPISYYFIDGLNGMQRSKIISQALVALHETGINVVSITCDGACSNISMLNNLGANISVQKRNSHLLKKKDKNSDKKCQQISMATINEHSGVINNNNDQINSNNDDNNNNTLSIIKDLKTHFSHPVTKKIFGLYLMPVI